MSNRAPGRSKQVNVRLNDEEANLLGRLASHYGLNAVALVRFLLIREEDKIREAQAESHS